ncbi:hypothetical protein C3L33_13003, partial [Rhododendron williamsianum]
MALFLALCLLVLKFSVTDSAEEVPNTLNEACIGTGGSFFLEIGIYTDRCPEAEAIIFSWVEKAVSEDPRMAASLLRLHFHDCFVNASSGGPGWEVQTGRRDSLTASKTAANNNIPGPNSNVATLVANFQNAGLTLNDMVALSGAHTMGKARCFTFGSRLNGNSNSNGPEINVEFLQSLQQLCSVSDVNATLAHLDLVTPSTFDNQYYVNLLSGEGLLVSDQVLVTGDDRTREIVESYASDPMVFFEDFRGSVIKMGSLGVLTGENGEIRTNCRTVNQL